jgi:hypothetical protein
LHILCTIFHLINFAFPKKKITFAINSTIDSENIAS